MQSPRAERVDPTFDLGPVFREAGCGNEEIQGAGGSFRKHQWKCLKFAGRGSGWSRVSAMSCSNQS